MRVVVDNNIVRTIVEDATIPTWVNALQACRDHGWKLSLGDGPYGELLVQIAEGRLMWQKWVARRSVLRALLEPEWPVLPGNADLFEFAAIHIPGLTVDLDRYKRHFGAAFNNLMTASTLVEVERGAQYNWGGKRWSTPLDKNVAVAAHRKIRAGWVTNFLNAQPSTDCQAIQAGDNMSIILAKARAQVDSVVACVPPLSTRLDASLHVFAQFHSMRTGRKSQYNPESDKRRSDVFDWSLLDVLVLPETIVVTAETSLPNRVSQTSTAQRRRVLHISTLQDYCDRMALDELARIAAA